MGLPKFDISRNIRKLPSHRAASQAVGCIKGKNAIHIGRTDTGRKRNFLGHFFCATAYYGSTQSPDEGITRAPVRKQEKSDKKMTP